MRKDKFENMFSRDDLLGNEIEHPQFEDEFGNPVEKTKFTNPYNYGPFVIWRTSGRVMQQNGPIDYTNGTIRNTIYYARNILAIKDSFGMTESQNL